MRVSFYQIQKFIFTVFTPVAKTFSKWKLS